MSFLARRILDQTWNEGCNLGLKKAQRTGYRIEVQNTSEHNILRNVPEQCGQSSLPSPIITDSEPPASVDFARKRGCEHQTVADNPTKMTMI